MLEYECPHCGKELRGSFGDNVYCDKCDKTYETDWDYVTEDNIGCWLGGTEYNGKVDVIDDKEEYEGV